MKAFAIRYLAWLGAACVFFALLYRAAIYRTASVSNPDAALRNLLADRQAELTVPYKVVNSIERRPPLLRGGRFMRYFRLQLQSGDGERLVHDEVFRKKVLIARSTDLWKVDDQPDWWKIEDGEARYSGGVDSKDTREVVYFQIVIGATNDWIFIDSVTLK